ncbi:MAG: hypothetical protein LRS43_03980 [Desulfurococcales archaeon]|nr:hypothetical protein [Desulfurococcales archaeon]
MVKVFLVLPDLSRRKAEAIERLYEEGLAVRVLASYTILLAKPRMLESLKRLKLEGAIEEVMLDSGAYHVLRQGAKVDVSSYAGFASRHGRLWDYVVAPDVPGDPAATIERTLEFSKAYKGDYMAVAQGGSVEEYVSVAEELAGIPGSIGVLGVGGLDGEKRRLGFASRLVGSLAARGFVRLHLFGAGAKHVRGLARRGLLSYVSSIDTTAWLAEIVYRRRTVYGVEGIVEANMAAITGYMNRILRILRATATSA